MSRVLIADDHAVCRAGYRQFLVAEPTITEVGEAATGNETLDLLRQQEWDLLLMDIHMPDRTGLDVLKHVVNSYPDVRVLIMSGLPEEHYARIALRAGASGYFSKGDSAEEFLKAVRTVLTGRHYISASLAELLVEDLRSARTKEHEPHIGLSSREFQIFFKLASGMAPSTIAEELSLSVKTISTYRSRVMQKLGMNTNADLSAYAMRHGIIQ
jgi:two-component system, NarL family, invasion response regulator UvrY